MYKTILLSLSIIILLAGLSQAAGARTRIQVHVEGVDKKLQKNVLSFLSLEKDSKEPELNDEIVKALFARAPDEIRAALQPFGFYTPDIKSSLSRKNGTWQAVFRIQPGARVIIRKMVFIIRGDGAGTPLFMNFRKNFPIKEGGVLNEPLYEKAKRDLELLSSDKGYLNSSWIEHKILVYPERHAAEIYIEFDTGPQFKFGDVTFTQTRTILDTEFLRKFVNFRKGEPFSQSVLLAFQESLSSSNYFSQVQVTAETRQAVDLIVPIKVVLTPNKRFQIYVGGGYGTDTGLRGRINWVRPAGQTEKGITWRWTWGFPSCNRSPPTSI